MERSKQIERTSEIVTKLNGAKCGDVSHNLQKLESFLCSQKVSVLKLEEDTKKNIQSATLELRDAISKNEKIKSEIEEIQKISISINEEIAASREEMARVTTKEDQRTQMRIDLISERNYIKKSIEDLKNSENRKKLDYSNHVQDCIEAHKLRLKQLMSDDSSDFAELIDEEVGVHLLLHNV